MKVEAKAAIVVGRGVRPGRGDRAGLHAGRRGHDRRHQRREGRGAGGELGERVRSDRATSPTRSGGRAMTGRASADGLRVSICSAGWARRSAPRPTRAASVDAIRDGAAGEPDRNLQRPAVRRRRNDRERRRRGRARRVRRRRVDRRLRRPDRADRVRRLEGRDRQDATAGGARSRGPRHPGHATIAPGTFDTPLLGSAARRRRATSSARRSRSRPARRAGRVRRAGPSR